ncbi:MAG: DUF4097 domain-containing protein [Eggerthellaceae bacterium]|nr:DUF4097 domain-containing protein [Eggerthellaceae bacterium]
MSKAAKTTLIVATALIVAGVMVSGLALAVAGFDIRRLSNVEAPTEYSYTSKAGSNYQTIIVQGRSENYRIAGHAGNNIEITYYEDSQTSFTFEDSGNTLVIIEHAKPGFMIFNFDIGSLYREIVISVPAGFKGSIDFSCNSGNVALQGLKDCPELKVDASSGNVSVRDLSGCGELEVRANSGNIVCSDVSLAKGLSLTATSGNISCTRVQAQGIAMLARSGNINCDDTSAKENASLEATSGYLRSSNLQAQTLSLKTASGNIRGQGLSAENLNCQAASGNIDVSLRAAQDSYWISASSRSGNVRVPLGNPQAARGIELRTGSGNITLSFTN